jgi:hypothetical protein
MLLIQCVNTMLHFLAPGINIFWIQDYHLPEKEEQSVCCLLTLGKGQFM